MDASHWFLLGWAVVILYVLGQIWFAQLVVHPLFGKVGPDEYVAYRRSYSSRIPLPVILPGFASFLSPIALVFARPESPPPLPPGGGGRAGGGDPGADPLHLAARPADHRLRAPDALDGRRRLLARLVPWRRGSSPALQSFVYERCAVFQRVLCLRLPNVGR